MQMMSVPGLVLCSLLILGGCVEKNFMSKAGIPTYEDCAKYSSEDAIATCESAMDDRRPTFCHENNGMTICN